MPTIILDTETTGTDPRRDKIVEIGAVDLDTRATFHAYYNPGIPVPVEATAVHGLTDAFLADYPPFTAEPLLAFIGDATLVAHNAPFDMAFLNAALGQLPNPVIDTLALAKRKHPLANNTLDALCRRYGISTAARTKHGALVDAELLAAVFAELIGRQATLALPSVAECGQDTVELPVRHKPLVARLTAAERAQHIALIDQIPNAIWNRFASRPRNSAIA